MVYEIEVIEILKRRIQVESSSETEALSKVEEQYVEEDIVLDSGDYSDTRYEVRDSWHAA